VGGAPVNGVVQNGHDTVLLSGGNGIKIADQLGDMVSASGYTIPMLIAVGACSTFDTDSFFAREQVIASASGGGLYCGLSKGDVGPVPTPGTANICHQNFNGGFAAGDGPNSVTPIPTSGFIFVCLRYDGTDLEIKVNSAPFQPLALAGPLTLAAAVAVHLGYSGSAAAISSLTFAEIMASATVFNDTKVDDYKAYFADQWNVVL